MGEEGAGAQPHSGGSGGSCVRGGGVAGAMFGYYLGVDTKHECVGMCHQHSKAVGSRHNMTGGSSTQAVHHQRLLLTAGSTCVAWQAGSRAIPMPTATSAKPDTLLSLARPHLISGSWNLGQRLGSMRAMQRITSSGILGD
jgi:hypothetical protein